jgi:hypothetical protein
MATVNVRDIKVGTRATGTERREWPAPATLVSKKKSGKDEYDLTFKADSGEGGSDTYPGWAKIYLA